MRRALTLLLCLLLLPGSGSASSVRVCKTEPLQAAHRLTVIEGQEVGEVRVGSQVILRVRAPFGYPIEERARIIAGRLNARLAGLAGVRKIRLGWSDGYQTLNWDDDLSAAYRTLTWDGDLIATVDPQTARLNRTDDNTLAKNWLNNLLSVLARSAWVAAGCPLDQTDWAEPYFWAMSAGYRHTRDFDPAAEAAQYPQYGSDPTWVLHQWMLFTGTDKHPTPDALRPFVAAGSDLPVLERLADNALHQRTLLLSADGDEAYVVVRFLEQGEPMQQMDLIATLRKGESGYQVAAVTLMPFRHCAGACFFP